MEYEYGYQDQERPQWHFMILPIGFFIIQIVMVSVLVFFISKFFQNEKIVDSPEKGLTAEITNISDAIPKEYPEWSRAIEWALLDAIIINNESRSVAKNATTSSIREGTIKTKNFEKYGINYVRMVVDVPKLEESYELFLEYSNEKDAIGVVEYDNPEVVKPYSVHCATGSDIIYSSFNCRESSKYTTRQEIVSSVLGYFDFDQFAVSFKGDDSSNIYISSDNLDDGVKQTYIQEVKDAILSLGISPELFNYQFDNQLSK